MATDMGRREIKSQTFIFHWSNLSQHVKCILCVVRVHAYLVGSDVVCILYVKGYDYTCRFIEFYF